MLEGKPIAVRKVDAYRVAFDLPQPYSVPDRLFDGISILPRHKLEAAWKQGKLAEAWALSTPPAEIAGLGPFRLKEYVAGQRITLERNPYYWKADRGGHSVAVPGGGGVCVRRERGQQVLRFQAGESDVISRVGARNFAALEKDRERRGYELRNGGRESGVQLSVFQSGRLPAGTPPRSRPTRRFCAEELPPGRFGGDRSGCHRAPGLPGPRGGAGRARCRRATSCGSTRHLPAPARSVDARGSCWRRTASTGPRGSAAGPRRARRWNSLSWPATAIPSGCRWPR